jgi:hypothetical protein
LVVGRRQGLDAGHQWADSQPAQVADVEIGGHHAPTAPQGVLGSDLGEQRLHAALHGGLSRVAQPAGRVELDRELVADPSAEEVVER